MIRTILSNALRLAADALDTHPAPWEAELDVLRQQIGDLDAAISDRSNATELIDRLCKSLDADGLYMAVELAERLQRRDSERDALDGEIGQLKADLASNDEAHDNFVASINLALGPHMDHLDGTVASVAALVAAHRDASGKLIAALARNAQGDTYSPRPADREKMRNALLIAGVHGWPGAWRWHSDPLGTTHGDVAAFCRLMLERLDARELEEASIDNEVLVRLMAVHGYTHEPGVGWKRFGGPVVGLETAIEVIEDASNPVARAEKTSREFVQWVDEACDVARALAPYREETSAAFVSRAPDVAALVADWQDRGREIDRLKAQRAALDDAEDAAMVAQGDPVKGAEAGELRAGIEDILAMYMHSALGVPRSDFIALLDRVNARDSNAFLARQENLTACLDAARDGLRTAQTCLDQVGEARVADAIAAVERGLARSAPDVVREAVQKARETQLDHGL